METDDQRRLREWAEIDRYLHRFQAEGRVAQDDPPRAVRTVDTRSKRRKPAGNANDWQPVTAWVAVVRKNIRKRGGVDDVS